ncbi:MAG: ferritin family protein, partial [Candidatus Omnitrophota bacterium]
MNLFHISEVVDMGIEKEKKRRDFYDLAAKSFQEEEAKKLFLRLRDWEVTHIKKFTEIKESLGENESSESYPGELSAYMRSLVDDKLYNQATPAEFSKNVKTVLEAIQYALGFEKDAILFFSELKSYTSDTHKEVIQQLIDEEKQHIIYLVNL